MACAMLQADLIIVSEADDVASGAGRTEPAYAANSEVNRV